MNQVAQINTYHVQQFAQWVQKLKAAKEGDGSVLDNSMVVYGAGLSDGNSHRHDDLPTIIAGRGGNFVKTGRRVVYRKETPMCNLFLTMMDRMGTRMEHFGDATGHLEGVDPRLVQGPPIACPRCCHPHRRTNPRLQDRPSTSII